MTSQHRNEAPQPDRAQSDYHIPEAAPGALVEPTLAVRQAVLDSTFNDVAGTCYEASLIVAWILLEQGLPAEMWNYPDWPHWCCASGDWILDPTAGQCGQGPPLWLLYERESTDDWYYDPRHDHPYGRPVPDRVSEEEIVDCFAEWGAWEGWEWLRDTSPGRGHPAAALLALAGLERLSPQIEQLGRRGR